jgi:hypothetical protein
MMLKLNRYTVNNHLLNYDVEVESKKADTSFNLSPMVNILAENPYFCPPPTPRLKLFLPHIFPQKIFMPARSARFSAV